MAYVITEITNTVSNENKIQRHFSIIDWNVLNLMEQNENKVEYLCNSIKNKSKKGTGEPCGKKAKYKKGDKCYCDKHSKTCGFILPTKENSMSTFKKKSLDELVLHCNQHFIALTKDSKEIKKTKKAVLEIIEEFYKSKLLEPIKLIKDKTAGETDLILIGRNMKVLLDKIPDLNKIQNAIIENQISPIATRMKTIQGMLTQYFIHLGCPTIEYISSSNKLKGLENTIENPSKYKEHKLNSVYHCNQFLEKNPCLVKWKGSLSSTKKDDMTDSFLQCIMWLKNKKMIDFKEDYVFF
jgi:hypothetical protein